jgi:HlyD family secretion protein
LSPKKKILIGVGIAVALGAVIFANFKFQRTDGVEVNVETIQKRKLEAIVSASGKIQPKRSVNISADTTGRVTSLAVNEGDRVKVGQFLLQIDPRNLRTRVQSGEASLEASRSQAEQIRLSLEAARLALKQAQDNYNRQSELMKGGLTTREQLERAENELKTRQADLRAQEQQVKTQTLRMQQERAALDSARYDLSKVRIESPITGIVTRRNIEEGETVVIGTMNNPGTVLLTIADMSVIEAEVEVDETDIPNVKLGQTAKITIDAMPGKTFTARVTEIGNSPIQPAGAPSSVQATNFKVVVTVDGEIPEVRPGFTCTAEITTATRDSVISVPIQATTVREMIVDDKGAIVRDNPDERRRRRPRRDAVQASSDDLKPGQARKELEGVFVVRDNKAVFQAVKTGIAGEKYFEVLSGLKEGDQVIVGPFSSVRELTDGGDVKVEQPTRRRPGSSAGSQSGS